MTQVLSIAGLVQPPKVRCVSRLPKRTSFEHGEGGSGEPTQRDGILQGSILSPFTFASLKLLKVRLTRQQELEK
jgi:hypothetical protein